MGSCFSKDHVKDSMKSSELKADFYFPCNDTLRYFQISGYGNHNDRNAVFDHAHNGRPAAKWNSQSTEEEVFYSSENSFLSKKEMEKLSPRDFYADDVFEKRSIGNTNAKAMTWNPSTDFINMGDNRTMKIIRFNSRTVRYYSETHRKTKSIPSFSEPSNDHLFLPIYPVDCSKGDVLEACRWIGSGTFSQVYEVKDTLSGKHFALKRILKSNVIERKMCAQVVEEIDILTRIQNHPFVLGMESCWQTNEHLLQLLPFAPHGDLYTLWKKVKRFPLPCVARVSAEIADALDHVHRNTIIYRDLKMENILISPSGHALLSDFGLAKYMGKLTRTYSICGTLSYLAPEIASGYGHSYECDWWSLGVVIVGMSTGKLPFKPGEDHIATSQIIDKSMRDLPKMTNCKFIREVILKLLRYEACFRVSSLRKLLQLKLYAGVNMAEIRNAQDGPLKSYFDAE